MFETSYRRPGSLAEAIAMFGEAADARYLAGGHTLIPTMKQRLAAPSHVIDIAHLGELQGIAVEGEMLVIGAVSTHDEVANARVVKDAFPALADLAGMIGDPAVRHRGTIGGSVANNDPAADYPAALLAVDAIVHTDRREIAAAEFFTGLFATALEEGEVVTRVAFAIPAKAAYRKFANPASRYAMAGVFVAVMKNGGVRVAVTGAGADGAFRASEMERALADALDPAALESVTVDPGGMLSDIHGSAVYRANLVKVMARRAVAAIA
jgi:aerobic carbon-monoxide dehydrogenase medium subunit